MLEKERAYGGGSYLEPELTDVLAAEDLGTEHIVPDWPWGRKERCEMRFSVESHPKRGERLVKQSRKNGRTYKPKATTYATRVKIIRIDGKIGHVVWNKMYGHFGVSMEDGKIASMTFFDEEAQALAEKFFGAN